MVCRQSDPDNLHLFRLAMVGKMEKSFSLLQSDHSDVVVVVVVVAVVVVVVDSPEQDWQSGHKGLKIVVTVVFGIRFEFHIPENLRYNHNWMQTHQLNHL